MCVYMNLKKACKVPMCTLQPKSGQVQTTTTNRHPYTSIQCVWCLTCLHGRM